MKNLQEIWPGVWKLVIIFMFCFLFSNGHSAVDKIVGGLIGIGVGAGIILMIEDLFIEPWQKEKRWKMFIEDTQSP